ncbi:WG repeat-containing protein, partial [Marinigracilibium pacificum]
DASDENRFIAIKDKKYGLIDDKGEVLVPFEYAWLKTIYTNRYVFEKDKKRGIVSDNGNIVLTNNYILIMPIFKVDVNIGKEILNLVHAIKNDTLDYFIPGEDVFIEKNNVISTSIFIESVGEKLIPYSNGDFTGYIDIKGKKLINLDSSYTHLSFFYEEVAITQKILSNPTQNSGYHEKAYGLINKQGQEIVSPVYQWMGAFSEGLVSCNLNDKFGAINKIGEVIIPFEYESEINYDSHQLAIARKGRHYGVIDKNNQHIIPFEFNKIIPFDEGNYYLCYTGVNQRIYNTEGKMLLTLNTLEVSLNTQVKVSYHQF